MQIQFLNLIASFLFVAMANHIGMAGQRSSVQFDLPPTAVAKTAGTAGTGTTLVTVELCLSSMINTTEVSRIDQWIVRCQPRNQAVTIADYAPRTETSSDIASTIQVKQSEEECNSLGVGLNGNYGSQIQGNAGLDRSMKNVNSLQFDRLAPLHAVTASGTINRGRGVYFKLRWTAEQVLEGEKTFRLTLTVPANWRSGLIDVSVLAQSQRKSFAGWDRDTQIVGSANFVVAAYREGDLEAEAKARELSEAEYLLRCAIIEHGGNRKVNSLPSMLRHLARKLDPDAKNPSDWWLQRLLLDRIDTHMDTEIRELPMPIRVAILEYDDARDSFLRLRYPSSQEVAIQPNREPTR